MKNNKKMFFLMETLLAVMVIAVAFIMVRERNGKEQDKISVIIQDSEDTQWAAFQYGLKMAAEDMDVRMFIVSTGSTLTAEEEKSLIEREIDNGADAIIVQPVPGSEEMLWKMGNRVPVMLIGNAASEEGEESLLPVVGPDNYALGAVLAEELLKDYNGNLSGKTLGIFSKTGDSRASVERRRGFTDAMEHTDASISWSVAAPFSEEGEALLDSQPAVDLVIALDDNSLTMAGEYAAANNLHGALVYGIGNSTEAVYYLDTGIVGCLVVPDEFNVGYQSLKEAAESLTHYLHKMQDRTVSYNVIRRDNLFSRENQEIIFTMSQ